uniref:Uncharacterized protein n=1 Tax=Macrostomum lignano TaxID=282301 RepID=A0A1I8FI47_9PLAT
MLRNKRLLGHHRQHHPVATSPHQPTRASGRCCQAATML